jgi:putative hydrolase
MASEGVASIPEEMKAMLGPMMGMFKQMSAVTSGMQMGNGLAALSSELLASGETCLPLSADGVPALLPNHVTTFATTNELAASDVLMFVAAREAAIQRLYAANGWLKSDIVDLVARYGRGVTFDHARIQEAMESVDPSQPESMQDLLASGVFTPAITPDQKRQLERLEFRLALIEGWVSAVVAASLGARLSNFPALQETMLRRRAIGGPAEKTFINLVGLELRPRLIRAATAFWLQASEIVGTEARDALWRHPDFLPTSEDLEDPAAFLASGDSPE